MTWWEWLGCALALGVGVYVWDAALAANDAAIRARRRQQLRDPWTLRKDQP
jgi:hypothetical protein